MYAAITSFVLDYNDHNDAIEISKRLARVVAICERKIEKSDAREILKGNFVLDLEMYHEKPKSQWLKQENSQSSSERSFLRVFEQMWENESLRSRVVFPIGFLLQKGNCESILFDKLNDSWKIGLPEDDDTHNKYLEELCSTLKLMHSCIVVHNDLMPCNIAWKMSDGNLLFLDFDAASSLSFHVGSKLNTMTLTNRKDKMWKEELEPDVRFDWWYLFLYSKIPLSCVCTRVWKRESKQGD